MRLGWYAMPAAITAAVVACSAFDADPAPQGSDAIDAGSSGTADASSGSSSSSSSGGTSSGGSDAGPDAQKRDHHTCQVQHLICDDFEKGSLWSDLEAGNNGTITSGMDPDGNHFMQVRVQPSVAGPNGAWGRKIVPLPASVLPGTLAIRANIRLPTVPAADARFLRLQAEGATAGNPPFIHTVLLRSPGTWAVETAISSPSTTLGEGAFALAAGEWGCVEVDILFPAGEEVGRIVLFGNTKLVLNRDATTWNPMLGFDGLFLNAGMFTNQGAFLSQYDIDDIAVEHYDAQISSSVPRLGCP